MESIEVQKVQTHEIDGGWLNTKKRVYTINEKIMTEKDVSMRMEKLVKKTLVFTV